MSYWSKNTKQVRVNKKACWTAGRFFITQEILYGDIFYLHSLYN
jgi:hypothetical protein